MKDFKRESGSLSPFALAVFAIAMAILTAAAVLLTPAEANHDSEDSATTE